MRPNILWLHADRAGCGSYRCYNPGLALQDLGYDNHFLQVASVPPVGYGDLADMHLVVFQRTASPRLFSWVEECASRGVPTVWEADDDIFNLPKHNPSAAYWHRKETQRLLRETLALVSHVIVSTPPLRQRLIEEVGLSPDKITVAYNFLNPHIWGPTYTDGARFANRSTVNGTERAYTVIGWQGSNTHDTDFKTALPALGRIIKEREDVVMRFFGNIPLSVRGVIPEHRFQMAKGVDFDAYPSTLAFMNFDIGLAPVTDNKFNQCKSNLKWLEYSALGVPTIASRVYPYERSIVHGETGFLAETEAEWYAALSTLADSAETRRQVGAAAKADVWAHWSLTRITAWQDVFSSLLEQTYGQHLLSELVGHSARRAFGAFAS